MLEPRKDFVGKKSQERDPPDSRRRVELADVTSD